MNHKKFTLFLTISVVLLILLPACKPSEDEYLYCQTPPPPKQTMITIDGNPDDWGEYELNVTDEALDGEEGYLDLADGAIFVNHDALYVMINVVDPQQPYEIIDIELKTDDRRYIVSWNPDMAPFVGDITNEFEPIGDAKQSMFAMDTVLEGRLSLKDIQSPENLEVQQVRVMAGECCEPPAWHAVDTWSPNETPFIDESDPAMLTSDDPKYTLARRFKLPEGYVAETLYAPPAPEVSGIARSESGLLYLQQAGIEPGISLLNEETGEVTRILDLPQDGDWYSSLVNGSGDTVIINVRGEAWMVSPDGSYEVWGRVPNGMIRAVTPDGQAYGFSHERNVLLEMRPDGTSREISTDFEQIYDIVADADGTLFVADFVRGSIIRFDPDGNKKVLAEKILTRDPLDLAMDSQGNLYVNTVVTGLMKVDRNTGEMTKIKDAHNPCTAHQADFVISDSGKAYYADPSWGTVTWADIHSGEEGMIVSNHGANTWAAAIGPDDVMYVGAWGCGEEFPAQVVRYSDNGQREVVVDGLNGVINDIAFAPDGVMYVSASPIDAPPELWYVPAGEDQAVLIPDLPDLNSITVDPKSGHVLASRYDDNKIYEISQEGLVAEHSLDLPMPVLELQIDTAPDGTLYAYGSERERAWSGPVVERWALELDLQNGTSEKIFQFDREGCCVMGNLSVSPAGDVLWLIDPEFIIYRIPPEGEPELIAQDLPIDPAAAVVDSQGDVYITSPSGIIRLYKEK